MTNRIYEIEDEINDIDKKVVSLEKTKDYLLAEISDIDNAIEDLEDDKEDLEDEYADLQAEYEPSLSVEERQ